MSSSTTEKHYIFTRVVQKETHPFPEEDHLLISFHFRKQSRCWYDDPTDYTCETTAVAREASFVPVHHREFYLDALEQHLTSMGVPPEEHTIILYKIFEVLPAAVRGCVLVLIADVTVRLLGSFDDHVAIDNCVTASPNVNFTLDFQQAGGIETFTVREVDYHGTYIPFGQQNDDGTTITDELSSEVDRLTLESFQTQWVRFVPATRSSVEKLQKVRLDSLEESTLKLNPLCGICRDDFAKGGVDQLVIPLPCAHYYHVDCIIRWLEVGHVCPLCRYALPTVPTEVDSELSNS